MRTRNSSETPNPFAIDRRVKSRPSSRRLLPTIRFLLLVAVCLGITVAVGSRSRYWLVGQITRDFETLSPATKKQRLLQLSELGTLGIPPVAQCLSDDDTDVARTAYELLQHLQQQWAELRPEDRCQRHDVLVQALNAIAIQMPDDRTGWASGLLNQTIRETVNRSDETSRQLYANATKTLELFTLSERSGPSVLSQDPLGRTVPERLSVRPQPISVAPPGLTAVKTTNPKLAAVPELTAVPTPRSSSIHETWTSWPEDQTPPVIGSFPQSAEPVPVPQIGRDPSPEPPVAPDPPSLLRSSSNALQLVRPEDSVVLRKMGAPQETSYQSDIRPVTSLVDSPMETLDVRSVIDWLSSPHQALREKANLELVRRGFNETQITIATRIANGDASTRMQLVDAIARAESIDPRPWLLLLLDDPHRDVKLRAISVLATMNDPAITQALRIRLVDQPDPVIAARLKRILN